MLVVYKRTTFERYGGGRAGRVGRLVASDDPSVRHLRASHDAHHETIAACRAALDDLPVDYRMVHSLEGARAATYDLVVTLGGDGTLLTASHFVGAGVPVVAVNSAPITSTGHFCAGHGTDVRDVLEAALAGRLRELRLARMQLDVDGRTFHRRVLNDVLFCHLNPAAATRYVLDVRGHAEEHLSSGVWIGPAAGSTAAQRSAGGRILPLASQKLQFVVREPYLGRGVRLRHVKGIVAKGERLRILSQIREGMLYVDGHQLARKVDIGGEITLYLGDEPLTLLARRAPR